MPPSTMSLLGLVRHMGRVEHNWFYRCLQGHGDVVRIFWTAIDGRTGQWAGSPGFTSPPGGVGRAAAGAA
ncbi:DUF664 domain-containing protein [Actinoplanes sp. LDG1-01]|uniref:DUF664 domain-containing protein n=1 Tax=Paractinoplanes lichenicola TaxID=2802976 RepID=A0ABS1VNE9_9ACTN|nr:DUF664 domain-containing protein [Actinoplanes lichenicola]